jgi:hypothetical protein
VPLDAVVEARDVDHTIYEMPLMLQHERLDDTVCRLLNITAPPADMTDWKKFVSRVIKPKKRVKIAVVGKYIELQDAYKSIYESLTHAAAGADCGIDLVQVDAEELEEKHPSEFLKDVAGVLVPGGFGRMLMTRRGPTALLIWHAGWFGGWFTLLFVRVQDLHLMTDYNYEAVRKLAGWVMIIGSALFFSFIYAAVRTSQS